MNINWDKIMLPKYAWGIVALLLLISLISDNGLRYLIKIRWQIRSIKKDIVELEKQNRTIEEKLALTRNNQKMMELYARTKLGMVKPDETVYEIK